MSLEEGACWKILGQKRDEGEVGVAGDWKFPNQLERMWVCPGEVPEHGPRII